MTDKVQCIEIERPISGLALGLSMGELVTVEIPDGTIMEWSWLFCSYVGMVPIPGGSYPCLQAIANPPEDAIKRRFERDVFRFFDSSYVSIPAGSN